MVLHYYFFGLKSQMTLETDKRPIWFDWEKKMKILSSSCIKQGGSQTLLPRRIY